jgi:hypothetical protein
MKAIITKNHEVKKVRERERERDKAQQKAQQKSYRPEFRFEYGELKTNSSKLFFFYGALGVRLMLTALQVSLTLTLTFNPNPHLNRFFLWCS